MNQPYKDIIRCWRIIEELTPPNIETKNNSSEFLKIFKIVLGDKELPWLSNNAARSDSEYIYYYSIFIGAIPIDSIFNKMRELLDIKLHKYDENFDSEKKTCLLSFTLDDKGIYSSSQIDIPDYLITIAARLKYGYQYDDMQNYAEIRNRITQEIKDLLDNKFTMNKAPLRNSDINDLNLDILNLINWEINEKINIISNEAIIYQHKVKNSKKDNQEFDPDDKYKNFFNSYFLTDLKKVEADIGQNIFHSTIYKYLSLDSSNKIDVRKNNYYENNMIPSGIYPARWPSKGDYSLSLAQTLAVKKSLDTEDIFSINGPPGTGKTTLIKDIIANLIFEKAENLMTLNDPSELFTDKSFSFATGEYNFKGWMINEKFLNFINVIASSNNEAVENITKELPFSIDEKWNVDYFKKEASDIFEKENATGLFSAALGNSSNKNNFFNKFWRLNHRKDGEVIKIDSFRNTLSDSNCNIESWNEAKNLLEAKINEYHLLISELILLHSSLAKRKILEAELKILSNENSVIEALLDEIIADIQESETNIINLNSRVEQQKSLLDFKLQSRPSFIKIFFNFFLLKFPYKIWENEYNDLFTQYHNEIKEIQIINTKILELKKEKELTEKNLLKSGAILNNLNEEYYQINKLYEKYQVIFSNDNLPFPDESFWLQNDSIIQKASPWLTSNLEQIRAEIFILSNNFIKYTIFMNKIKLTQNLNIMNMMMTYGRLPNDMKKYAKHIWNSFSLIVPTVSTTFASFSSLFKDLGSQEISYLLIDEAGQASPHRALGAIWRSKKIIAVGDPLQIEPVEIMPSDIGEEIIRINKIDIKYNPLSNSVQSFADSSNNLGTYIGDYKIWIGFPLRVHRRCNDPMFSISNQISYDNMMIYGTNNKESNLNKLFSHSLWIDINNSHATNKWIQDEGKIALNIINKIINYQQILPSIFIISPFKIIAKRMKDLLRNSMIIPKEIKFDDKKNWIQKSVGTIHSFQGKEADIVIIILGCDNESKGAVNWATSKPNILNVALTRAKHNVFIVGNSEIWGRRNYFENLYSNIKITSKENFETQYLN